jgi:hypothetical protein
MSEEKHIKKITLGLVLGWGFGVVMAISGITWLFSKPLTGILILLISAILLPPVNKFVEDKLKFIISGGLKFVLIIVLLGLIGASMLSNPSLKINSDQTINQKQTESKSWYEIKTFSGKGNQDTSSFAVTGDKVKITATTCCGSSGIGTYSGIDLKSDNGEHLSGVGLTISTDGAEKGQGETIYRNLKTGDYYLRVITGVSWNVKVEEYR